MLIVALIVVLIVAAFLVFVAMKPNSFRLQRSLTIQASPEAIYPHISDFHQWTAWSPWEKLDPDLKRSYSGQPEGKGAVYDWSGNGKAGTGRMEIKQALPGSKISIQLDFIKPFQASNTAEFTFQPQGDATVVTWAMFGPSPFMSKLMHTVFSMDAMVGKDFEKGLQSLKTLSEA